MTTTKSSEIEMEVKSDIENQANQSKWLEIFVKLSSCNSGKHGTSVNLKELQTYLKTESAFNIEHDMGISKSQLLYLISKLKKADKNQDQIVTLVEFEDWLQRNQTGPIIRNPLIEKAVGVVAFAPSWSCKPPTLFIILISFIQVVFYLLQ